MSGQKKRYYAVVNVRRTYSTIPVTMAKGKHLFPSRTQQLSPSAPRVLSWTRLGRVGRCRLPKEKTAKTAVFSLLVTTRQRPSRVATQCGIASVRRRKREGRTKRERLVTHLDTTWENRTLPVTKKERQHSLSLFFLVTGIPARRAHNGTPLRRAERFAV